MPKIAGYITLEKNIVGLSVEEMERTLGLPSGHLSPTAQIFRLRAWPSVGQFAAAGSTITPDRKKLADGSYSSELIDISERSTVPIPHSWLHQRLVKVKSSAPHPAETFPRSPALVRRTHDGRYVDDRGHVEQWKLLVPVDADLVRELQRGHTYWPR